MMDCGTLPLQIDGAILIIWGIVEFNAPAPAPGVTSVSGYATAMTPDIRHMLSHNWDPAMELTGKCEPD